MHLEFFLAQSSNKYPYMMRPYHLPPKMSPELMRRHQLPAVEFFEFQCVLPNMLYTQN